MFYIIFHELITEGLEYLENKYYSKEFKEVAINRVLIKKESLRSVSYTHLDVYKRQGKSIAQALALTVDEAAEFFSSLPRAAAILKLSLIHI